MGYQVFPEFKIGFFYYIYMYDELLEEINIVPIC